MLDERTVDRRCFLLKSVILTIQEIDPLSGSVQLRQCATQAVYNRGTRARIRLTMS
jgi:hypothetical protein